MEQVIHGFILWAVVAAATGYTGVHVTSTHSVAFTFILVEFGIIATALSRIFGGSLQKVMIVMEQDGFRELLINGIHPVLPGLFFVSLAAYFVSPAGIGCSLMSGKYRLHILTVLLGAISLAAVYSLQPVHGLDARTALLCGKTVGSPQPDLRLVLDVVLLCSMLHFLLYRSFKFVCLLSPTGVKYDRRCAYYHATLFATVALLATASIPITGTPAFLALLLMPALIARARFQAFPTLLKYSTFLALTVALIGALVSTQISYPCGLIVLAILSATWVLFTKILKTRVSSSPRSKP